MVRYDDRVLPDKNREEMMQKISCLNAKDNAGLRSLVDIVIPTMAARRKLLGRLLDSLRFEDMPFDIFIVEDKHLTLSQKRTKGARAGKGEWILFVDDDNCFSASALRNLSRCFPRADIGIIGLTACYDNDPTRVCDGGSNRSLITGFTTGLFTNKIIYDVWIKTNLLPYNVDEVANAFAVRRSLFEELNGFDTGNFPIDGDEADFCLRAKKTGRKVMIDPVSLVYHKSFTHTRVPGFRAEKNAYYMGRNKVLFQRKHGRFFPASLAVFLPATVFVYALVMVMRGKPKMAFVFTKGVIDGIRNRTKNTY